MSHVMMLPVLVLAAAESAVNRVIALDEDSRSRLLSLSGKVIKLELTTFPMSLYLRITSSGALNIMGAFDGVVDATLKGAPLAIIGINHNKAEAGQLDHQVEISGDGDVGHKLRDILGNLDIDWEEQLSRITGDIVAHKIGNGIRGLHNWSSNAGESLKLDIADYLQHEIELVPVKCEVEEFTADVDQISNTLDQLEQRVAQLKKGSRSDED